MPTLSIRLRVISVPHALDQKRSVFAIYMKSGKEIGFEYSLSPPLRTVRTTFTVHGSSNLEHLPMDL
jgi:hypothetical protein